MKKILLALPPDLYDTIVAISAESGVSVSECIRVLLVTAVGMDRR